MLMHWKQRNSKKVSGYKVSHTNPLYFWEDFFLLFRLSDILSYMYISVIPLTRSQSRYASTYFVHEDWRESITIGGLVEIPLGNSLVEWLITERDILLPHHMVHEDIKPIVRVISSIPLISDEMISMIEGISMRYFLLIHKVIGLFLPTPLLSRLDKKNYLLSLWSDRVDISYTPVHEIHHFVDHIFSPKDIASYLDDGTICIFPDDIFLSLFSAEHRRIDIAMLPNDATPTRRAQAWIDIYEKKHNIIFWTRRILYYNLSRYRRIIYVEDAFALEQYSYPTTLKNLDILRAFSESHKHDITIVTSTPTLNLLSLFSDFSLISIHS